MFVQTQKDSVSQNGAKGRWWIWSRADTTGMALSLENIDIIIL